MCAKWRKERNPNVCIGRIESTHTVAESALIYEGSFFDRPRDQALLVSALKFDPNIPSSIQSSIAEQAKNQALKNGNISAKSLQSLVCKLENEFLNKETTNFVLVSNISLKGLPFPKSFMVEGNKFVFSESLPGRFDRGPIQDKINKAFLCPMPTDYVFLRIKTQARCPEEAVEKALDCLSYILGMWNFALSYGERMVSGTSRGVPLAKLVHGPIHTLHKTTGELAKDSFWYEENYSGSHSPATLPEFGTTREVEVSIRKAIKKGKDPELLRTILIRYHQALSEPRCDIQFLRLWQILETLTDTVGKAYKETIKRTKFIFSDKDLAHDELEHLRAKRNELIHAAEFGGDKKTHVQQLKLYVDYLLMFVLKHKEKTQSLAEFVEFLDLPTDPMVLETKLAMYDQALLMHSDTT